MLSRSEITCQVSSLILKMCLVNTCVHRTSSSELKAMTIKSTLVSFNIFAIFIPKLTVLGQLRSTQNVKCISYISIITKGL